MSSIYLKKEYSYGSKFSIYKVERETNCFYVVKLSETCEEKIPKKKLEGEHGWWNNWRIATQADIEQKQKENLVYKVRKLIDKTNLERWSVEKLNELIDFIQKESF